MTQPERPDMRAYARHFLDDIAPEMLASEVFLAVYGGESPDEVRVQFATQLGFMLLHDKPIVLVCPRGTVVPERLRRVADEVVAWDPADEDPAGTDRLAEALRRLGLPIGMPAP